MISKEEVLDKCNKIYFSTERPIIDAKSDVTKPDLEVSTIEIELRNEAHKKYLNLAVEIYNELSEEIERLEYKIRQTENLVSAIKEIIS